MPERARCRVKARRCECDLTTLISFGQNQSTDFDDRGKKFGKKLGNAAIFGAGATIGGNIVNSIF